MVILSLIRRKGEILPDGNDKRSRNEKQKFLKQESKSRFITSFWKSEAQKVNEEKLKHYESTGNENKAAIYRLKLNK